MIKLITIILAVILLLGFGVYYYKNDSNLISSQFPAPTQTVNGKAVEVIAEGLKIPWEIAFLPNDEILITERPGSLIKIGRDKKIIPISGVRHSGEGGLLGLALHPDFKKNNWLYLYLTVLFNGSTTNRVERYTLQNDQLTDRQVIIENIPGAIYHDGGRIAFGPDGLLYITTGDATRENLAQDKNSLAGKILRLKADGSIPSDNPFGTAIYSYGHRNPQGLAWDNQGRLWATEHGRSGITSGFDELNLIKKGVNYGWPEIQGNEKKAGMETPVIHSGAKETWAPSGAIYFDGKIFFAGLLGESLYEAKITAAGTVESLQTHLQKKYGRLRTVQVGPDGNFYILTSNTDGRGDVKTGDDKLIRLDPKSL